MRIIDLQCYPNTEPWITCQGPYVEALAKYWNRPLTAKTEAEVVEDFSQAGVQAVLVALDLETTTGTPPCSNAYVAGMWKRYPDRILQAWGAVDPFKGETAIEEANTAIRELGMLGFHFHPIMGHFAVNDPQFYPLWETIDALGVPVMIDVGTTGMGAGMHVELGGTALRVHWTRFLWSAKNPAMSALATAGAMKVALIAAMVEFLIRSLRICYIRGAQQSLDISFDGHNQTVLRKIERGRPIAPSSC